MAEETNIQSLFNIVSMATNVLSDDHEGSVFEYSRVCHSPLLCTIEDRLTHNEVTTNIMKTVINVYIAHYLQSVALMNNLGSVNVRQVLDRLNPNRDWLGNARDRVEGAFVVTESYLGYPTFTQTGVSTSQMSLDRIMRPALEGNHPDPNSGAWATDAPQLGVGKVFDVAIQNDGKCAVIPVRVVLNPVTCNQQMFVSMYAEANVQNTWLNRIRRWRDGELTAIGDLLFVNDIISDKAKLLKADKKGIVADLERRRRANKLSTLITQKTSLATASAVSIITKETASEIAIAIGGRLTDPKTRAEVFAKAGLCVMVVVDTQYETCTLYYRGQPHGTELTYKEVAFAGKGDGPNVMEILRAFQSGHAPNI